MPMGAQYETNDTDKFWMEQALAQAHAAADQGEVPVGAVIVCDGESIAQASNQPISGHDASAHAEIIALRAAGAALDNYRLPGCTLYVTLEPCMMCTGAIAHARIERLVFGADDPRAGAVRSVGHLLDAEWLNHSVHWQGGVLATACGDALRTFFRSRR